MIPTTLQIFATIFAGFALSRVILRLKAHQFTIRETLFWSAIWASIIAVVWIPNIALFISKNLGLDTRQPIDSLVYVSIVLLLYLMYRIHAKQENLEQEVTRLIRIVSIQQAQRPKGKS